MYVIKKNNFKKNNKFQKIRKFLNRVKVSLRKSDALCKRVFSALTPTKLV